jgi:photosystem II stability/assembly factor-like uncharacterized protein
MNTRRCAIFSFLLMISTILYAQPETYQWRNVAIGGGGFVTGIIPGRTEQNLIYARTDVGGAYRWDAANNVWVPLLDWISESESGYLGVESIAIDPQAPNKLYMLAGISYFNGGKSAILRSSDYGNTFSVTDITAQFKVHGNGMGRQNGEKLLVDAHNGNILYCGTRWSGLFKSTNAGVTWSRLPGLNVTTTPNENGISFVVLDESSVSAGVTQRIFAAVSRTGTNLYRSDDGGTNFSAVTGGPTDLMPQRAVLDGNGNLYITYANGAGPHGHWAVPEPFDKGQIWKYTIASGVWTNVTPTGATHPFSGISIDKSNSNRIIASTGNTWYLQENAYGDKIFITNNGGMSWTEVVARGFDLDPNGVSWIEGQSIHWAGSIEFDPFNSQRVLVASGNGIFVNDNIDATVGVWKFTVNGLEETVPLDLVSVPNGPVMSVIGDYDGFRHTDVTEFAAIHTPRMGTTPGLASATLNSNIMLRVGEKNVNNVASGELYFSTDMGVSWAKCPTVKGPKGFVALSPDGNIFFHCPAGSGVTYYSMDQGANWSSVTGLSIPDARIIADTRSRDKMYAYNSTSGTMWVSNDGGKSFFAAGSAGSGGSKLIRLAPGKEGDVWVALYSNGLTRSGNAGSSFSKVTGVTYCAAVGFGKEAPGQAYPAIYIWGTIDGVLGIHRSIDEGATWKRINDDAHEYGGPGNGQFISGDMNVYGRVYMSTAGRGIVYGESGLTCIPSNIFPNVRINNEFLRTSYAMVEAGTSLSLFPDAPGVGTWAWTGPDNFSSTDQEIPLSDIQSVNVGVYSVTYTNADDCISAVQTFLVDVNVKTASIAVTGENGVTSVDEKAGTLQMSAVILPSDATNKSVVWSISNGVGTATISPTGLLTAVSDGEVTVKATATDGSGVFGEADILITNQAITAIEDAWMSKISIYPNPFKTEITIISPSGIPHVRLLDIYGREVGNAFPTNENLRILSEQIPPGVYLLELTDNNNRHAIKKMIKY